MKKTFILLILLILVAGFIWLGITQPQMQAKPVNQSIDTAQFISGE